VFHNRFLGTLNFKKGPRTGFLEPQICKKKASRTGSLEPLILKSVPVLQGLELVLEPLRTLDFVGFQEPVLWNPKFVKTVSRTGSLEPLILKSVPVLQGLELVLEPLRTLDFVGFPEPVLDGTLNLKKVFQNRFL
jgi:hypothetical protein